MLHINQIVCRCNEIFKNIKRKIKNNNGDFVIGHKKKAIAIYYYLLTEKNHQY